MDKFNKMNKVDKIDKIDKIDEGKLNEFEICLLVLFLLML